MQHNTQFSEDIEENYNYEKEQDIKLFKQIVRRCAKVFKIQVWEVIKIIEFCFGGRDSEEPGGPCRFVKFKEGGTGRDFKAFIIQYNEIQKILNMPNRELMKALRRTVPKLGQLDHLWDLRIKYPSISRENEEILVIKDRNGVYKQKELIEDLLLSIPEDIN